MDILTPPPRESKDSCKEKHLAQNHAVLVNEAIHLVSSYLRAVSYICPKYDWTESVFQEILILSFK